MFHQRKKRSLRQLTSVGAAVQPVHLTRFQIIILKKCPILRTLLHAIIVECWSKKCIPQCWKKSATRLIYKKGDTSDPSNFRPITLQPVLYKILAAIMRKRMFEYLSQNKLIDQKHQKGFWPSVDGVGEHTETLTHVIREAKRRQNSLVVTLLDLKNAFGEVQHELIEQLSSITIYRNCLSSSSTAFIVTR